MVKKKKKLTQAVKTWLWPTLLQSNWNFIALLFSSFCLVFTLSLELLNGLRSAAGLTQRIPPFVCVGGQTTTRAWFYDLSLQHPPTLWARSEGVSIADLHCTWGQIHTTTEKKIKDYKSCIEPFLIWPSSLACSFLHQCQSKASTYSHCQTYQGANIKAIIILSRFDITSYATTFSLVKTSYHADHSWGEKKGCEYRGHFFFFFFKRHR